MRILSNMKLDTNVDKSDLLGKLQENRERHLSIYEDARKGYINRAEKAILSRLDDLRAGKAVALHFNLHVPENHVAEYDTVIKMLEWSTDETVTISDSEFRMFVEDEWDWMGSWLDENSLYSSSAQEYAVTKGIRIR